MAMVGLFWITEDSVYIGAEPAGTAAGVRLSKDGVETLGIEHTGTWSWDEVRRIEVADVAVRPASRRWVSQAFDAAVVALTGDGELPPAFTVRIDTAEEPGEPVEVSVLSAVAGGIYGPVEYELSRTLLNRLVDGRTPVDELLLWHRDRAGAAAPGREEREALMLKWIGDSDPS
ncbi:hypothetical protein STRCI_000810 [Streptomyces cinnabarinus]|uniref:Uncharacterized protein n=1 Tax=Streptomyces cinnabarinus TaxID=67287 RepID=A0ABY7K7G9_9ACTN|nr:hypothetical protein [Streptomyces cinnabarinus]WAZ19735.1 hypothetical protein STRCI_000810 [Streptomyces cinnabarinus]